MNILAIVIPHSDRHTGDCSKLHFPLGLAYVIASIRKHLPGVHIRVLDFYIHNILLKEDIEKELRDVKKHFDPDFIIYGGMITRFAFIKTLSEASRKIFHRSKLVLGGSAAGSGSQFFLKDHIVDYLVIGEGEEAIIDILKGETSDGSKFSGNNNRGILIERAIQEIDSLPMPSYQDFMTKEYINNYARFTGWRYLPMVASRGCPFRCNFCYPNFGHVVRYRDEESVIEEMEYLVSVYHVDSINFWDEIQFLDKVWMERFCSKLINKKTGLKWSCASRASLLERKDMPLLKLAKKAGCLRITIGIESGNQRMLERMNKKTSITEIESALLIIRESGIKATGSMLIGYPGENPSTIQDSVDFANRNLLKTSFYCLIPLPRTEIYDFCIKNNIIRDESKYVEKISESGGDASRIIINLTEMDDQTYKNQVAKANKLVNKIALSDALNYYGILKGCKEYLKMFCNSVQLKINGRMWETP